MLFTIPLLAVAEGEVYLGRVSSKKACAKLASQQGFARYQANAVTPSKYYALYDCWAWNPGAPNPPVDSKVNLQVRVARGYNKGECRREIERIPGVQSVMGYALGRTLTVIADEESAHAISRLSCVEDIE